MDKAITFTHHLENVFKPFPSEATPQDEQEIRSSLGTPYQMDLTIKPFTSAEEDEIIKHTKTKKAPGYDLITGRILKELSPNTIRFFTIICNSIIRIGHFPTQWKVAQNKTYTQTRNKLHPIDPSVYYPFSPKRSKSYSCPD